MKCKNCKNRFKRRDDDGSLYDWCGMIVDSPDAERERQCKYYAVASNSDYMRAMSDEELAEFVAQQRFCTLSPIADKLGIDITQMFVKCRDNMLDWLKEECEN